MRSNLLGRMTAALGCWEFVHAMRGFVHVTAKAVLIIQSEAPSFSNTVQGRLDYII